MAHAQKLKLLEALESAPLTVEQKLYFSIRYIDLVQRYRKKYHRINYLYNSLRLTVMVGSIFIPALLTIQKEDTTIISITTYWVVFGLSLCVTLANSMLELFNVAALNTKYWLQVHRLETEGWQFLHLSDVYSKYESLQDAFLKFSSRVERLHMSLVFDLLRLENKNKTPGDAKPEPSAGTSIGQPQSLFGRPFMDSASNDSSQIDGDSKKTLAESLQTFTTFLNESEQKNKNNE